MVRSEGLEPSLLLQNSDLNAARLPIPPRPHLPLARAVSSPTFNGCEVKNSLDPNIAQKERALMREPF